MLTSVGGAAAILATNLLGITAFLASALPVVLMVAYLIFAVTRSKPSIAKIADSIYFMGFWLTLFALLVTLSLKGLSLEPSAVFQVFGYALFTTAAGMFMRMSLLQFNRTSDEQEHEAIDTLDKRVQQMDTSFEHLNSLIEDATQRLAVVFGSFESAVSTSSHQVVSTATAAVDRSNREVSEHLTMLASSVVGEVAKLQSAFAKVEDGVAESASIIVKTASRSSKDAADEFAKRWTELAVTVSDETSKIAGAVANVRAGVSRVRTAIDKHATTLETASATFAAELETAGTRAADGVAGFVSKIEALEISPGAVTRRIDEMTSGTSEILTSLNGNVIRTERSFAEMRSTVESVNGTIATLPAVVADIRGLLQELSGALANVSSIEVPRIRQHVGSLEKDLAASAQGLQRVADGVGELMAVLNDKS